MRMDTAMNQKERMLAGLPYKAWLDGLTEEREENKKRIYRYNNTPPEQGEELGSADQGNYGKCGKNIFIDRRSAAITAATLKWVRISSPTIT